MNIDKSNSDKTNILNLSLYIFMDNAKNILTHHISKMNPDVLRKARIDLKDQLYHLIEAFYIFIHESISPADIKNLCDNFIASMAKTQTLISEDIQSAYDLDPSAYNKIEIILCFSGVEAIIMHRIAHTLHKLGIPILPRMIAREVHRRTSIDIHPAAQIGTNFFIDHGTGVVIGETSIVGNFVTLYHGVTLGAKSFPKNNDNTLIRNLKRHPNIEDHVTIYSNSTILGDITIGKESVIGANVSITQNIAPHSRIYQQKYQQITFEDGMGI